MHHDFRSLFASRRSIALSAFPRQARHLRYFAVLLVLHVMVGEKPDAKTHEEHVTDLIHKMTGNIAHVTFNRPARRNALTFAMYEELAKICDDPGDVRAIIISGAGGAFFRLSSWEM